MSFYDKLRSVGVVVHFIGVVLFLVSMGTVHWMEVKGHPGTAGLWQYCDFVMNETYPSSTNITGLSENSSLWSSPGAPSTTTSTTTSSEDEDEEEEEEAGENCMSFGVVGVDGYLHSVRVFVVGALFCFAYGLCKGTTLKSRIEYDPCCMRQHAGELLSVIGGLSGICAVQVYRDEFRSDSTILPYLAHHVGPEGEKDRQLLVMGWSAILLQTTSYVILIGVALMLMPTIGDKVKKCFDSICECRFLDCDHQATRPSRTERTTNNLGNTSLRRRSLELNVDLEMGSHTGINRRHSDGSLNSTISISRQTIFVIPDTGAEPDPYEPAPRYEDIPRLPPPTSNIPPPSSLPPPPSYDDVLKGLYTAVPSGGGGDTLPPPPPYTCTPSPPVTAESLLPRPLSASPTASSSSSALSSTGSAPSTESNGAPDNDVHPRRVGPLHVRSSASGPDNVGGSDTSISLMDSTRSSSQEDVSDTTV